MMGALIGAGIDPTTKIYAGIAAASLHESIEQARVALDAGAKGLLVAPPFYFKGVGDEGLYAWFSQFFGEERTRAQELIDEGYEEYSFSIVGYFGGEPVWHASRFDEVTAKECLIVDAVGATQCVPQEETLSPGAGIVVEGASVDTIDGGSEPWSISLGFTSARSTYLTIRGDAAGERSSVPEDDAPGS
jgi:hypothetical protein